MESSALSMQNKRVKRRDLNQTERPKGNPNSEGREAQVVGQMQEVRSYSDLPLDIVGNIIGRLRFIDRVRIRRVCKDWSVLSRQIIPTVDKYPWAMTCFWWRRPDYSDKIFGNCKLTDPPVRKEYTVDWAVDGLKGEAQYEFFCYATARASSYGWLLVEHVHHPEYVLFLYCPFTREVIKLPELKYNICDMRVTTFRLDATSPKCVVFALDCNYIQEQKVFVNICCPGDISWKTFEFSSGLHRTRFPVHAAYAYGNGNFYCLFSGGELGAFNVGLGEWTTLTVEPLPGFGTNPKLIVSDGDLQLMVMGDIGEESKLLKFDFSEKRWVQEINLNNRVLFLGCTSFSCPAVGEISELANHVLTCNEKVLRYGRSTSSSEAWTKFPLWEGNWLGSFSSSNNDAEAWSKVPLWEGNWLGSTSSSNSHAEAWTEVPLLEGNWLGNTSSSNSQQYRNWLLTARGAKVWMEVPLRGVWTANDLINAAL
ncbi:hypothetical protein COLO4_31677 [Corchorus olitorius]|uniref:F-box domain-containing protein n=1 Tax=Corchorus olitorius TaxID=93759 RepID=A0A1R3H3L9_9ROSI|nr:hypothetical protein COLO4_31677 [Corchorus olitorius]